MRKFLTFKVSSTGNQILIDHTLIYSVQEVKKNTYNVLYMVKDEKLSVEVTMTADQFREIQIMDADD